VGGLVDDGITIVVRNDRKKQLATIVPAWLVDRLGDENEILELETHIVTKANGASLTGLISVALKRFRELISPQFLVTTVSDLI
jgi:hypothetical protein